MSNSFFWHALLLVATSAAVSLPAAAQVKVWQGTMALPTYEEGPPDPNPPSNPYAESLRLNDHYTIRGSSAFQASSRALRSRSLPKDLANLFTGENAK